MFRQLFSLQKIVQTISPVLLIAIGWFATCAVTSRSTTVDDDTALFMRAKLVSSQKVMEGLVTEDFSMIKKGAEQMRRMSQASHWPQSPDQIYAHFSESFKNHCSKLAEQAGSKNHQAAHYTYLHLTTTCIDCHNYVRGKYRVERDADNPRGPIQLIPTEWDGPATRSQIPAHPSKALRDREN